MFAGRLVARVLLSGTPGGHLGAAGSRLLQTTACRYSIRNLYLHNLTAMCQCDLDILSIFRAKVFWGLLCDTDIDFYFIEPFRNIYIRPTCHLGTICCGQNCVKFLSFFIVYILYDFSMRSRYCLFFLSLLVYISLNILFVQIEDRLSKNLLMQWI